MQDKNGIPFTNAGRQEIEEARKVAGWTKLNYMLLGMCLVGALWTTHSLTQPATAAAVALTGECEVLLRPPTPGSPIDTPAVSQARAEVAAALEKLSREIEGAIAEKWGKK